MNNSDQSAYPMCDNVGTEKDPAYIISNGLTKREYYAAIAMQGLCSIPERAGSWNLIATSATAMADALIKELEK